MINKTRGATTKNAPAYAERDGDTHSRQDEKNKRRVIERSKRTDWKKTKEKCADYKRSRESLADRVRARNASELIEEGGSGGEVHRSIDRANARLRRRARLRPLLHRPLSLSLSLSLSVFVRIGDPLPIENAAV